MSRPFLQTKRLVGLLASIAPMLILAVIGLGLISCGDDNNDPTTSEPPVFSATPVDIAFDPADSSWGEIVFIAPVLIPFGADIGNNEYSPGVQYFVAPGARVRAVTEGIVDTVIEDPDYPGDYEIRVVSLPGSEYLVIYKHVGDVAVSEAMAVHPGDTLGRAGSWNDFMSRTMLQITTGEGTNQRSYCPLNYGDSAFVQRHQILLQEYNRRGFDPHYDTLCLKGVITP